MTPYAIPNCPRAQYDAIEAINQSKLKHFEKSAAHFRHEVTKPKEPPSDTMTLGCFVEHLTLGTEFHYEPMRFDNFRTDAAKAWKKDCQARGIAILDEETRQNGQIMADRVTALPEYKSWNPRRNNIALVGTHDETGLAMKGLCDMVPDNHLVIVDLKTTRDASEWGFGRSICDFGYDCQAWWYTELWRQVYNEERQFAFICVENEPPFEPSIQVIPQKNIDLAGTAIGKWMRQYARCLETNEWPGYPSGLTWARVPKFRFMDLE